MRGTLQVFDSSSKTLGYTCVLQVRILPILECDACTSFYVPPLLESGASYKHIISTVKHWTAHSEWDLKKKKKKNYIIWFRFKIHLQMSSDQVVFAIDWIQTKLSVGGFWNCRPLLLCPFYRWVNWGTERSRYSASGHPDLFPSRALAQSEIMLLLIDVPLVYVLLCLMSMLRENVRFERAGFCVSSWKTMLGT